MKIFIVIRTNFEALHCWPECPYPGVSYLVSQHRHVFYVEMKWLVDVDREKEFILLKTEVNGWLRENWERKNLGSKSCEMLGVELMERFNADYVSVFEDNENGAEVLK